jgi:uncharacterized membrane protein YqjE
MDTAADRGPAHSPHAPLPPGPGVGGHGPSAQAHEASFLEPLERVFATLRRMAGNYALLAVHDLRRASIQLAWLIASCIFITVLVVTAWLCGIVALAVVLFGQGMSWPAVLCTAAAINLVGAGIVVWRVSRVFDQAPFAATLRQIKAHSPEGEADAAGRTK